ncbi:hypothetical protein BH10PAT1_BH10PAT1_3730 [soil metagenome]
MANAIHLYPHKISANFRVILLLIPAIVFVLVLSLLIAIKI